MKYLCWDDDNDTRGDAKEIEASDEHEAAELFAERAHYEEQFDSIDVLVEAADGKGCVIRVGVDWEPTFAAERTPR